MVDVKISELNLEDPAVDDELEMQRTADGNSFKTTVERIANLRRAVGSAHSSADYTMLGVTTTPAPLNGYDASEVADGVIVTLTPTAGSNTAKFTVAADKDGLYRVTFNIEVASTTNESIDFIINKNAVATEYKTGVDLSNASIDLGSAGINAFLSLVATDVIEMYIRTDGAAMDILIDSLTFTIQKV